MNDDPRDDADRRALAEAWRAATVNDADESPSPAVDAAILAAARAAVRPRRPRYALPLALAASLVVAVGLGLRQQRETLPPTPSAPSAAEPAAPEAHTSRDDVDAAAEAAAAPPAPSVPAQYAAPNAYGVIERSEEAAAPPARRRGELEQKSTGREEARAQSTVDALAEPAGAARLSVPAEASNAASADVVADIRARLAAGDRASAAALARDYVGRSPPGVLPPDLEFLLMP